MAFSKLNAVAKAYKNAMNSMPKHKEPDADETGGPSDVDADNMKPAAKAKAPAKRRK